MRVQFVIILAGILILGLFGTIDDAYAVTCVSQSSGNWNDNIWKDGEDPCTPGVSDRKVIVNGHTVTMSSAVTSDGPILVLGGTLIVASTFTHNGFFDGMTNNSVLNSAGNVTVTSTGIYQNNGQIDNFFATLTINSGGQFFNNYASGNGLFHTEHVGATVTVNGNLTNTGDLLQGTFGMMTIGSGGILTNTGANAVFDNRVGATLDNDGGTVLNKSGGTIFNNGTITNNGKIENFGVFTNNSTLVNDGWFENNKLLDSSSGTISNSCLINNSGTTPNSSIMKIQNQITNTGMVAIQPGGVLDTGTGTVSLAASPNKVIYISESEIVPEDNKLKGRVVAEYRTSSNRLDFPLRDVTQNLFHSGPVIVSNSDKDTGDFSFDLSSNSETVSLNTILKDGTTGEFPNGQLKVHNNDSLAPASFTTENFDSCIKIAYIELGGFASNRFTVSGGLQTPIPNGIPVANLKDLGLIYYYSLLAFDVLNNELSSSVTLDDSLPLEISGYSSIADSSSASHFDSTGTNGPTIRLESDEEFAFSWTREAATDVLFHEFGHYINYESRLGGENDGMDTTNVIHSDVSSILNSNCHEGYAHTDSSCSWSEGFASFIGAVIADIKLTDDKHKKFQHHTYKFAGGSGVNYHSPISVYGSQVGNVITHRGGNEEFGIAALMWGIYSSKDTIGTAGTISTSIETIMAALTTPANSPSNNAEVVTTTEDLFNVLQNAGILSSSQAKGVFGDKKICIDENNDFKCQTTETHGETSWEDIRVKSGTTTTTYSQPDSIFGDRSEPPLDISTLTKFNVGNLTNNPVPDGTEITIEVTTSEGHVIQHGALVVNGELLTGFIIEEGDIVKVIFSDADYFSETVTITAQQYADGYRGIGQMNSLEFDVQLVNIDNPCTAPESGDWIITISCTLQQGDVLTISPGVTLTIDSGVTVNNSGTITNFGTIINSGDIINCGTYTGTLPSGNPISSCSLPGACSPPVSGDWTVSTTCTMTGDETANGNVIVPNGVVLTVPNLVTLDINFASFSLTVQAGGGVLIESGGKIT